MPSLATLPQDIALFAKYHLKRRVVTYPAPETELGIVPLGFELPRYVETIRGYDDRFDVTTIAEVQYLDEPYPILEARSRTSTPRRRLLVLAGVHGNEHAGLLAVPPILDRFDAASDVALSIVTPVNPVGAAHLSRYNGEGYDINRDFVRFFTPEARAVREVIERFEPDFIVSLHEGPQDATFMFANRRVDRALALRLLERIEARGSTLAERDYFGRRLVPPGYSPIGAIAFSLHWLWARTLSMMATGMYADERGIPEITLESGWRLPDREARVRAHVELIGALLDEL